MSKNTTAFIALAGLLQLAACASQTILGWEGGYLLLTGLSTGTLIGVCLLA